MTFPKYTLDPKKIAVIIGFHLVKLYKSARQPTISSEVFVPKAKENLLPILFSNPDFWGASFVVIISLNILKNIVASSHGTQTETQNEKKNVDQSPPSENIPEKSKQKNKHNLSPIRIKRGEIGKIIQESKHWDEAIVDFSIDIPSRFQELKTKAIADQAVNEAILIVEEI